ncbi:MAG TPA: hypothetical protein VMH39_05995 [Gemmatimonadaceae bacterium]|nr:hypothetical protein [Gemmatimonadaceae bacterium]
MRILVPLALWVGALQLPLPEGLAPESTASLLTAAATLAGLTVMVYRLGMWRQDMHNMKHNIGAEVSRYREETNQELRLLGRGLESIQQYIAAATEQRVASERWQARVDTTIENHERELTAVGGRVGRLEAGSRSEAA